MLYVPSPYYLRVFPLECLTPFKFRPCDARSIMMTIGQLHETRTSEVLQPMSYLIVWTLHLSSLGTRRAAYPMRQLVVSLP